MRKFKSEILTQELLNILNDTQKLKSKYGDLINFITLETHLKSSQKLLHELTLKIKNQDND